MPTSLTTLVLLLILLGPGFCFVAGRERKYPASRQSSFRESVNIAAASIILNAVAIGLFALLRILFPNVTPNIGALLSEPHKYFLANYRFCIEWAVGVFAVACGFGFSGGIWLKPGSGSLDSSAWWEMFEYSPNAKRFVGCQLTDGSYISGELFSYSTECEESDNRELVLLNPLFLAADSTGELETLGSDLTSVSAKRILFVSTNFVPIKLEDARKNFRTRLRDAFNVLLGKATLGESQSPDALAPDA
jgi:hypothetical protein